MASSSVPIATSTIVTQPASHKCLFITVLTWWTYHITMSTLLSRWLQIFHPHDYSVQSQSACVCSQWRVSSFTSVLVFMTHSRLGAERITTVIVQRGTSKWSSLIGLLLEEYYWLTRLPSYISNDSRCTSISPRPFMALYRTSASALALKFPLAFTVPLLACNKKDVDRGGLSWCRFFHVTCYCEHSDGFMQVLSFCANTSRAATTGYFHYMLNYQLF